MCNTKYHFILPYFIEMLVFYLIRLYSGYVRNYRSLYTKSRCNVIYHFIFTILTQYKLSQKYWKVFTLLRIIIVNLERQNLVLVLILFKSDSFVQYSVTYLLKQIGFDLENKQTKLVQAYLKHKFIYPINLCKKPSLYLKGFWSS